MAPTKLPHRTIVADDFVVEIDGVEYRPHAGESITLSAKKPGVDEYLFQLRTVALQKEITDAAAGQNIDAAMVNDLADLAHQGFVQLASYIRAWTWTDEDGNPYPSPPTVDALRSLSQDELDWIRGHVYVDQKAGESKNGSSPSPVS